MLTDTRTTFRPARRPSLWRLVMLALLTRRERKALGSLDAHLLRDIGVEPEAAEREAGRPLWDVPGHWQR